MPPSIPARTLLVQTDFESDLLDAGPPSRLRHRPAVMLARLLPESTAHGTTLACGAEYETDPAANTWVGCWIGYVEGVERIIVPLDSEYFAEKDRATLGLSSARCARSAGDEGCIGSSYATCSRGAWEVLCHHVRQAEVNPSAQLRPTAWRAGVVENQRTKSRAKQARRNATAWMQPVNSELTLSCSALRWCAMTGQILFWDLC
ncbi:hypothetical protein B0H14DRAFT_2625841 [Mycena olivaceomarginata]|nr:hypothetical protein B0H14DRAFT_2625841 [Mycena olivaceomarginata]